MNELYNETIERRGKIYHYDPDYDIYHARSNEGTISKYSWIVFTLLLALVAAYIEFIR